MDLLFSNFLNVYSSLGIDYDPHVLYDHMTYVYSFSCFILHAIIWPREVIIALGSFMDFGVLLFYGRILTLILFYFLHNPTTPILPVYINQ